MQFGPRLMRRTPPFGASPKEEMEALRATLASCPGVNFVLWVEAHHKGGYVSVLDFDRQQLDGYIGYMENHGWMNVM
jgi:hypothetical protein